MRHDRSYLFFAVNYFAQGMAGLAYEPISYYLKDALGLGPQSAAVFVTWMTLPLTIKPLFGLLTDFLPWAGRRRGPHLIAVSLLTMVGWLLLAVLKSPSCGAAAALLVLVNVGFVLSDVVCDGVMVERGKERGLTGRYQAVQIGTMYAALVVTGLGGGWLAGHASYHAAFTLAALFPLMTAMSSVWINERGVGGVVKTAARSWTGLKSGVCDQHFWAVAGGIFLWSFCPFLGTAQFYYQSEALKLSPLFIGGLATAGGLAGMAGAALFARLTGVGRHPSVGTERVARASIWIGAPLSLLYVLYRGPGAVVALTLLLSLTGVIFRLAWMDLAAKSCPEGAEATVFAAYMAVFNIAASASNALGGVVYERLAAKSGAYAAMVGLTLVGTAGTIAAWPLLRFALRHDAMRRRGVISDYAFKDGL